MIIIPKRRHRCQVISYKIPKYVNFYQKTFICIFCRADDKIFLSDPARSAYNILWFISSRQLNKVYKNFFIKNSKKRLLFAFLFGILFKRCGSLAQLGEQLPYKQWVTGSSPVAPTIKDSADEYLCGNGSVVERHLAKVNVAGSNLVSRSTSSTALFF